MKTAVIGSRTVSVENIGAYLPSGTSEIVSGGAKGVDSSAKEYAKACVLTLTEFLPEHEKYGRAAPLRRNIEIIEYADVVVAIWDGKSRGTKYVIDECRKRSVPVEVYIAQADGIVRQ